MVSQNRTSVSLETSALSRPARAGLKHSGVVVESEFVGGLLKYFGGLFIVVGTRSVIRFGTEADHVLAFVLLFEKTRGVFIVGYPVETASLGGNPRPISELGLHEIVSMVVAGSGGEQGLTESSKVS